VSVDVVSVVESGEVLVSPVEVVSVEAVPVSVEDAPVVSVEDAPVVSVVSEDDPLSVASGPVPPTAPDTRSPAVNRARNTKKARVFTRLDVENFLLNTSPPCLPHAAADDECYEQLAGPWWVYRGSRQIPMGRPAHLWSVWVLRRRSPEARPSHLGRACSCRSLPVVGRAPAARVRHRPTRDIAIDVPLPCTKRVGRPSRSDRDRPGRCLPLPQVEPCCWDGRR